MFDFLFFILLSIITIDDIYGMKKTSLSQRATQKIFT